MSLNTTSGVDEEGRTLRVRPLNTVPPGVPVRHFDQLPERGQQLLADHGSEASIVVAPDVATAFADEPVVVFSRYLRVEVA